MPLGGGLAIAMGAVSLGSAVTGAIQKGKALKIQKQIADKQAENELIIANKQISADKSINQSHDLASLIKDANDSQTSLNAAVMTAAINAQTAQNVAAINSASAAKANTMHSAGNNLLIVAAAAGVVSLLLLATHRSVSLNKT